MGSNATVEHFVTLFDSHYLLQGLSLYRSLEELPALFHLWIVALDEDCANVLRELALPHATIVPLPELENEQLLLIKSARTVAEYCWTLTPFVPAYVFDRSPGLHRITYLDADLFFFDNWTHFAEEFARSGKDVLITEHAFAPEYIDRERFGRFCVQFMTFKNTIGGINVMRWWQNRCIEWCYARDEDGKFGDQKYLDAWPTLFQKEVHVLQQKEKALAPWNVEHFSRIEPVRPVFYHFHSLKIVGPHRVLLHADYVVGRKNCWIYDRYLIALRSAAGELRKLGVPLVWRPLPRERYQVVRNALMRLVGTRAWARI